MINLLINLIGNQIPHPRSFRFCMTLVVVKFDEKNDRKHGKQCNHGEETQSIGVEISSGVLFGG